MSRENEQKLDPEIMECLERRLGMGSNGILLFSLSEIPVSSERCRVVRLPCKVTIEEKVTPTGDIEIIGMDHEGENYEWISECGFDLESCEDYTEFVEETCVGFEDHATIVNYGPLTLPKSFLTYDDDGIAILNIYVYLCLNPVKPMLPRKESVIYVVHTDDHEVLSTPFSRGEVSIWLAKNGMVYEGAKKPVCSFDEFQKGPYYVCRRKSVNDYVKDDYRFLFKKKRNRNDD
ncbi:MAG: hypothetical protein Sylvanvirus13_6 [Sylvanvirus sp.]|uniref:Uncharacterized protein n=1 Tax=Sylvanvirus sp. TaxID=2487774 RepID=A0A3G5ALN5_9VIRU|nr:MAG: hypothetical protein Sylvanvirus13_6 [Sylvanvirus sp.]